ncbi:hypothetical protein MKX03_012461 [Papaver bracteatum]|nr:hypothetical protein MKX03_012461 [Papaver bracteatum]
MRLGGGGGDLALVGGDFSFLKLLACGWILALLMVASWWWMTEIVSGAAIATVVINLCNSYLIYFGSFIYWFDVGRVLRKWLNACYYFKSADVMSVICFILFLFDAEMAFVELLDSK